LVFSSSCSVYGLPERVPITEKETLKPVNPYGKSKMLAEKKLREAEECFPFRSVSLRYFNASGADPEGELGEQHDPETHVIPLVLRKAAGGREPFIVHGNDYDTVDGTCVRDYVHVSDLSRAHIQALKYLERGGETDIFNLGSGDGVSVLEIIQTAEEVTGKPIPYEVGPRREGDPATLIANCDKAREKLEWDPQFNDLRKQIEHAWMWLRKLEAP